MGHSPSLIEPVIGKVILRNLSDAKSVSAKALDGAGHAIGEPIAATKTDAGWVLPIGKPVTTWFIVNVDR
jgi:hypothetical protein